MSLVRTLLCHGNWLGIAALAVGCGGSSQTGMIDASSVLSNQGSGSSGSLGSESSESGSGEVSKVTPTSAMGGECPAVPACDAAPPDPGAAQGWRHTSTGLLVVTQGTPRHRGRDLFLAPTEAQWVLGKFAYGLADKDLTDEDVDIYLLRNCAGSWEKLGTATTTEQGRHPVVEGVQDTGGRVFFPIPLARKLTVGRHRVRLVVRGDLSATELFIEVLEPGSSIFVSDIDGTLTTSATEEYSALLQGTLSEATPNAALVLSILAAKGMRPFYLTARPDWLDARTREFLRAKGFPPGIVHTALSATGAPGHEAARFKGRELGDLVAKGLSIAYAFGDTATDGEAYDAAGIQPVDHRLFYKADDPLGGRRVDDYNDLGAELVRIKPVCPM